MPDGTSVGGETVARKLNGSLNRLTIATIVLYIITLAVTIGGFVYMKGYVQDNREVIAQTTDGICALKVDLQQRIEQTDQFLKDHPDGIPGISADALQQSQANAQRTLDALSTVECPPVINSP